MGRPRLLLVEDDRSFREAVTAVLERAGYEVRSDPDGGDLAGALTEFHPDLALFDVPLPDGSDGIDLAARLRTLADVPVVFLTASDGLEDRLRSSEDGADDYLVKPFVMAELLLRVRAVLRRTRRPASKVLEVCGLLIDEANLTVGRNGQKVALTRIEFDLLAALAEEPGRVRSRQELMSLVWGFDGYTSNLVEVHISALRRKLDPLGGRLIHTERSKGYVLRDSLG